MLAELLGAGPDPAGLAVQLLWPSPPAPLMSRSAWSGVTAVAPGHWVDLASGRAERWWTPPDSELPLAQAAVGLRAALETAVRDRQQGKRKVACDLSGLDSSSLLGIAARGGPVVGLTVEGDDPMDGDAVAAQFLANSVGADHDLLPADEAPLPFQGMKPGPFDEPTSVSLYRGLLGSASARALRHQAELRFAGYGADEMLLWPPVWLTDIARRSPLRAARLAKQIQAKYRLSAGAIAGVLTERTPYAAWFATSLDRPQAGRREVLAWGNPPQLPDWLTADAKALARDAFTQEVEPLAATRGVHATLESVHSGAAAARHVAQQGEADGVPVAVPFLDDRVLEACLAVRPDEVLDPRRYKPLLATAMAGVLPERTLQRTDKAETSMAVAKGWSKHRAELLALLDDSELGRLGLVDVAAVRRICQGPHHDATCGPVERVLEIEAWLKGVR